MRTIPRPMRPSPRPSSPPASYLASQPCIVCRDTPTAAAVSVTVRPSLITASTARYRCSATLNSLIRECQGSAEVGVNHQPKPSKASAEVERSSLSRRHTRIKSRLGESHPRPTHYENDLPVTDGSRRSLKP